MFLNKPIKLDEFFTKQNNTDNLHQWKNRLIDWLHQHWILNKTENQFPFEVTYETQVTLLTSVNKFNVHTVDLFPYMPANQLSIVDARMMVSHAKLQTFLF